MSELDDLQLEKARSEAAAAATALLAAEEARLKAVAERETAEDARDKARDDQAEYRANASQRQRTAELAAQSSQLDNVTKLQGIVADATPDLSKIERGELAKPDDKVMFATMLKTKALRDAAVKVRTAVKGKTDDYRVVVTADPALLQRDAFRIGLQSKLSELGEVLSTFPPPNHGAEPDEPAEDGDSDLEILVTGSAGIMIATAAAKLIPGLIGLFAAHRKLTTQELTVEDQEAVLAVAGELASAEPEGNVMIDSFRFLFDDVEGAESTSAVLAARDGLHAAVIALQVAIGRESTLPKDDQDAAWLVAASALASAGRDALTAADAIPPGGTMSPLTAAIAVERLRLGDHGGIVLIDVAGASAVELTSDRAAAFKDSFHAIGTVALTYAYIDRRTSKVLKAGVVTGHSGITAKLGSTINVSAYV